MFLLPPADQLSSLLTPFLIGDVSAPSRTRANAYYNNCRSRCLWLVVRSSTVDHPPAARIPAVALCISDMFLHPAAPCARIPTVITSRLLLLVSYNSNIYHLTPALFFRNLLHLKGCFADTHLYDIMIPTPPDNRRVGRREMVVGV